MPTKKLVKQTPTWAKWMFRIVFGLTTAATGYIAATNLVPESIKYEVTVFLNLFVTPVVYLISKMFGVEPKEQTEA